MSCAPTGSRGRTARNRLRLPPFNQLLQLVAMVRALPEGEVKVGEGILRAALAEHAGWASLVLAGRHWRFHDPLDLDRAADGTDPVPVMASVVSDAAAASMAVTLVAAATIPNIAPKAAPEATTETTPENTPEAAPVNLHHRPPPPPLPPRCQPRRVLTATFFRHERFPPR